MDDEALGRTDIEAEGLVSGPSNIGMLVDAMLDNLVGEQEGFSFDAALKQHEQNRLVARYEAAVMLQDPKESPGLSDKDFGFRVFGGEEVAGGLEWICGHGRGGLGFKLRCVPKEYHLLIRRQGYIWK